MKNTRRFGRRTVAAVLLLSAVGVAAAKARPKAAQQGVPRYGVMVYSDLCLQESNGDIGGQRVSVHRFAEVDTVYYEFTAGGLSWPLVASEVAIDAAGGALAFTVAAADQEERKISGKFSRDGRTLLLDGAYCDGDAGMPMRLSRVSDFGAKLKPCKPCPATKAAPEQALPAPAEPVEMPAS
ncbi:hypothetical protein ACFDR9_000326 [Janthinobacterium sp. CG_23.3]|uniref:hypothetical protein n=1 Tax=unclassified Janthinobacterium TaxID=2610881 RepID=UPI00034811D7|nr:MULTISPECIES: hypothetical protein [unclassified Janthinobacterium]MEC5160993.1 hypothetical protein [Janthinobacterium sp. CG_S6]